MPNTTVDQATSKEDVKDVKSSQTVSEKSQGTETKKKPGPKPKVKVEDSTSEKVESKDEDKPKTDFEKTGDSKKEADSEELKAASQSVVIIKDKVKQGDKAQNCVSEFAPAHILHRCPVYKTPSTKGVIVIMASGFVFCEKSSINGFYKIKYNSFERGARIGYVESKYIAFGAKK